LLDVQQMAVRVLGKCLRELIAGSKPSEEEQKHAKWVRADCQLLRACSFVRCLTTTLLCFLFSVQLTSPLFEGGLASEAEVQASAEPSGGAAPKTPEKKSTPTSSSPVLSPGAQSPAPAASAADTRARSEFLTQLIAAAAGSDAAALDQYLRKACPKPSAQEMMGGEVVKRTVRMAIAAWLKHLGLVDKAMRFDTKSSEQIDERVKHQLLAVWTKGQRLHRHIIQSRQAAMQSRLTRVSAPTETKGAGLAPVAGGSDSKSAPAMSDAEIAAAEYALSYDGWCAEFQAKSEYLLSLTPTLAHVSAELEALSPKAAGAKSPVMKPLSSPHNAPPEMDVTEGTETLRLVRMTSEEQENASLSQFRQLYDALQTAQHWYARLKDYPLSSFLFDCISYTRCCVVV
jgi:hypothetical protein